MRLTACLIFFISFAFLALASASSSKKVIYSSSDLNKNKLSLDGQDVILRGYLIHEPGAYAVWNNPQAREEGDVSKCVSLQYSENIRKRVVMANRHYVILKGTFHRNVTKGGGIYSGLCNYTGIAVSEVIEIK